MLLYKINQLFIEHTCVKYIRKMFDDLVAEESLMDPVRNTDIL